MTRVLVIDDEPQIVRALVINLKARKYEVDAAHDGATALRLAAARHPDVVVLDLGLPDMDGVEVIKGLRGWTRVPILVLSARHSSDEKVEALDAGADDYVTKPFGMDELLARLRAAMRRAVAAPDEPIRIGRLTVDLARQLVLAGDEPVHLSRIEYNLLALLARNEGKLLTHRAILREVWGPSYQVESHYLHVYISRLRQKIEPDPQHPEYLITEPGAGYRLVRPPS